jgi:hypothetical protein
MESVSCSLDNEIRPCPLRPGETAKEYPSLRGYSRRTQAAAVGVMLVTLTGIIIASQPYLFFPPPVIEPRKGCNTDIMIWLTDEEGNPQWTCPIRIIEDSSIPNIDHSMIDIIECEEGGFAVAAPIHEYLDSQSIWRLMLIRINDRGTILWQETYTDLSIEPSLSLVSDSNGGFVVSGIHRFFNDTNEDWERDIFLAHFDNQGSLLWNQIYYRPQDQWESDLVSCLSGGYAILATTELSDGREKDFLLIRTDKFGNELWGSCNGNDAREIGQSLVECQNGDFVICGQSSRSGSSMTNVFLYRLDSQGTHIWDKMIGNEGLYLASDIIELDTERFAITGAHKHADDYPTRALYISTDVNGEQVRSHSFGLVPFLWTYGYYYDGRGYSIYPSEDGNFTIIGMILTRRGGYLIPSNWDILFLKTSPQGSVLVNRTLGNSSWDFGFSHTRCSTGGYVIAAVRITPLGDGLVRQSLPTNLQLLP